jgi:Xaa-Pro aminopeptidase
MTLQDPDPIAPPPTGGSPDTVGAADRLARLAGAAAAHGADAVLVSPGADLQYLAGASVNSHERLTVLVVPAAGEPALLVPALERAGWTGSPIEALGVSIVTWLDGEDCYQALAGLLPADARVLAVDDHMPAVHALGAQGAVPGSELVLAGAAIADLRLAKSAAEIEHLRRVGAAVDRVQARIAEFLRPGRTERAVQADIAAALVEEGHAAADFVIVGSGPNSASPHHEASDRVIQPGDPVVIDIGGPEDSGYFSDCTRTYLMGGAEPPAGFFEVYEIVRRAQQAGVAAARPGVAAQDVDRAARTVITEAGYGPEFLTRTGHGIGLEVHEQPYIVEGNDRLLDAGMAFSVEPGIYLAGRFGIRIEDIVVVTADGAVRMNEADRQLVVVG